MNYLVAIFTVAGLVIFTGLLGSLPVWLLWNGCLVGAIQGVNEITWLQSWGLVVLVNMLFKLKVKRNV